MPQAFLFALIEVVYAVVVGHMHQARDIASAWTWNLRRSGEIRAKRRALKPVRDLFGWVGDTFDAKKENKDLKKEVERLRSALAESQTAERDANQLKGLVGLTRTNSFPQGTRPIAARVNEMS